MFEKNEKAETSNQYKTFLQNLLDELYLISVKLDENVLTPVLANQNLRNLLTKTNLMFENTLKSENSFFENIFLNAKSILEYATSIDVMSTTLLPYSSVVRQTQIQILILSSKNT